MNAHDAIKASMTVPDMIMNSYLGDLTDEELLVRPTEGANHIAWQLGHLLTSEHGMIEQVCPGSMPALNKRRLGCVSFESRIPATVQRTTRGNLESARWFVSR